MDVEDLSMLESRIGWSAYTGDDAFGNPVYSTSRITLAAIIETKTVMGTPSPPSAAPRLDYEATVIVDSIGAKPGDKILISPHTYYVHGVDTVPDELGTPYMQTLTLSSRKVG